MFKQPLLTTMMVGIAVLVVGCQQPPAKTTSVTFQTNTGTTPALTATNPVVIQVTPAPQQVTRTVIVEQTPPVPKVNTSPWIGKTIDEIVGTIGAFRKEVDMGNDVHAFQFQAKPKKPKCVASYLASRENDEKPWIVQEYIAPDPKTC